MPGKNKHLKNKRLTPKVSPISQNLVHNMIALNGILVDILGGQSLDDYYRFWQDNPTFKVDSVIKERTFRGHSIPSVCGERILGQVMIFFSRAVETNKTESIDNLRTVLLDLIGNRGAFLYTESDSMNYAKYAVNIGDFDLLRALKEGFPEEQKVYLTKLYKDPVSILMSAISKQRYLDNPLMFEYLLDWFIEEGGSVNDVSVRSGASLFSLASEYGSQEIMSLLIAKGINITHCSNIGVNALVMSSQGIPGCYNKDIILSKRCENIQFLIGTGEFDVLDNIGRSSLLPSDIAKHSNLDDVIPLYLLGGLGLNYQWFKDRYKISIDSEGSEAEFCIAYIHKGHNLIANELGFAFNVEELVAVIEDPEKLVMMKAIYRTTLNEKVRDLSHVVDVRNLLLEKDPSLYTIEEEHLRKDSLKDRANTMALADWGKEMTCTIKTLSKQFTRRYNSNTAQYVMYSITSILKGMRHEYISSFNSFKQTDATSKAELSVNYIKCHEICFDALYRTNMSIEQKNILLKQVKYFDVMFESKYANSISINMQKTAKEMLLSKVIPLLRESQIEHRIIDAQIIEYLLPKTMKTKYNFEIVTMIAELYLEDGNILATRNLLSSKFIKSLYKLNMEEAQILDNLFSRAYSDLESLKECHKFIDLTKGLSPTNYPCVHEKVSLFKRMISDFIRQTLVVYNDKLLDKGVVIDFGGEGKIIVYSSIEENTISLREKLFSNLGLGVFCKDGDRLVCENVGFISPSAWEIFLSSAIRINSRVESANEQLVSQVKPEIFLSVSTGKHASYSVRTQEKIKTRGVTENVDIEEDNFLEEPLPVFPGFEEADVFSISSSNFVQPYSFWGVWDVKDAGRVCGDTMDRLELSVRENGIVPPKGNQGAKVVNEAVTGADYPLLKAKAIGTKVRVFAAPVSSAFYNGANVRLYAFRHVEPNHKEAYPERIKNRINADIRDNQDKLIGFGKRKIHSCRL